MGDEAYGKEIVNQLDSSNLWRTFFVSSGRQASGLPHNLLDLLPRSFLVLHCKGSSALLLRFLCLQGGQGCGRPHDSGIRILREEVLDVSACAEEFGAAPLWHLRSGCAIT